MRKKFPEKKKLKLRYKWKAWLAGGFFILCLAGAAYKAFLKIDSAELKKNVEKSENPVVEKKAAAIWCQVVQSKEIMPISTTTVFSETDLWPESGSCFYVDNAGVIFREAPETYGTLISTFYGYRDNAKFGEKTIEPALIEFAGQIKEDAKKEGFEFIKFLDESVNSELKAMSADSWIVYFDSGRSADAQVKVLSVLLKDLIKDHRINLWYVDLRVAGRAYYKLKPASSSVFGQ